MNSNCNVASTPRDKMKWSCLPSVMCVAAFCVAVHFSLQRVNKVWLHEATPLDMQILLRETELKFPANAKLLLCGDNGSYGNAYYWVLESDQPSDFYTPKTFFIDLTDLSQPSYDKIGKLPSRTVTKALYTEKVVTENDFTITEFHTQEGIIFYVSVVWDRNRRPKDLQP